MGRAVSGTATLSRCAPARASPRQPGSPQDPRRSHMQDSGALASPPRGSRLPWSPALGRAPWTPAAPAPGWCPRAPAAEVECQDVAVLPGQWPWDVGVPQAALSRTVELLVQAASTSRASPLPPLQPQSSPTLPDALGAVGEARRGQLRFPQALLPPSGSLCLRNMAHLENRVPSPEGTGAP